MESKWPILRGNSENNSANAVAVGSPFNVWVLLGSKILVKAVGPAVGYVAPGGAFVEDATNQVHNRNERERWGWGCS